MPKRYPREFRRRCDRLLAGERLASSQRELGVSRRRCICGSARRSLTRAEPGVKSFEADELAQAHRTIAELEAELEAVKAAAPCSTGRSQSAQKAVPGCRRPEQPGLLRARRLPDRRGLDGRASTSSSTTCHRTARSAGCS